MSSNCMSHNATLFYLNDLTTCSSKMLFHIKTTAAGVINVGKGKYAKFI